MPRLIVNGEPREWATLPPLPQLVAELTGTTERAGYAVARNGTIVPRSRWDDEPLADGDELEIAAPFQGG